MNIIEDVVRSLENVHTHITRAAGGENEPPLYMEVNDPVLPWIIVFRPREFKGVAQVTESSLDEKSSKPHSE